MSSRTGQVILDRQSYSSWSQNHKICPHTSPHRKTCMARSQFPTYYYRVAFIHWL